MAKIKNVNGFIFAIINEETAKERLKNNASVFVLHEDGTETQAENENDINTALKLDEKFGVEIGIYKDLRKEFEERFRIKDFFEWLDDKINIILQ